MDKEGFKTREEAWATMHPADYTFELLLKNAGGCISVWSSGYIKPDNVSQEALNSLNLLIEHGLVKDRKVVMF